MNGASLSLGEPRGRTSDANCNQLRDPFISRGARRGKPFVVVCRFGFNHGTGTRSKQQSRKELCLRTALFCYH
jgi:hypothetical protein